MAPWLCPRSQNGCHGRYGTTSQASRDSRVSPGETLQAFCVTSTTANGRSLPHTEESKRETNPVVSPSSTPGGAQRPYKCHGVGGQKQKGPGSGLAGVVASLMLHRSGSCRPGQWAQQRSCQEGACCLLGSRWDGGSERHVRARAWGKVGL